MFFNLVSGSCCYKVRAWYRTKNNAYDQQSEHFGYYTMQPGTVNGKAHYKSTDGNSGIWYEDLQGVGVWNVGKMEHFGFAGKFSSFSNSDCPYYRTGYSWSYLDQYENFRDADEGFSIVCKS